MSSVTSRTPRRSKTCFRVKRIMFSEKHVVARSSISQEHDRYLLYLLLLCSVPHDSTVETLEEDTLFGMTRRPYVFPFRFEYHVRVRE